MDYSKINFKPVESGLSEETRKEIKLKYGDYTEEKVIEFIDSYNNNPLKTDMGPQAASEFVYTLVLLKKSLPTKEYSIFQSLFSIFSGASLPDKIDTLIQEVIKIEVQAATELDPDNIEVLNQLRAQLWSGSSKILNYVKKTLLDSYVNQNPLSKYDLRLISDLSILNDYRDYLNESYKEDKKNFIKEFLLINPQILAVLDIEAADELEKIAVILIDNQKKCLPYIKNSVVLERLSKNSDYKQLFKESALVNPVLLSYITDQDLLFQALNENLDNIRYVKDKGVLEKFKLEKDFVEKIKEYAFDNLILISFIDQDKDLNFLSEVIEKKPALIVYVTHKNLLDSKKQDSIYQELFEKYAFENPILIDYITDSQVKSEIEKELKLSYNNTREDEEGLDQFNQEELQKLEDKNNWIQNAKNKELQKLEDKNNWIQYAKNFEESPAQSIYGSDRAIGFLKYFLTEYNVDYKTSKNPSTKHLKNVRNSEVLNYFATKNPEFLERAIGEFPNLLYWITDKEFIKKQVEKTPELIVYLSDREILKDFSQSYQDTLKKEVKEHPEMIAFITDKQFVIDQIGKNPELLAFIINEEILKEVDFSIEKFREFEKNYQKEVDENLTSLELKEKEDMRTKMVIPIDSTGEFLDDLVYNNPLLLGYIKDEAYLKKSEKFISDLSESNPGLIRRVAKLNPAVVKHVSNKFLLLTFIRENRDLLKYIVHKETLERINKDHQDWLKKEVDVNRNLLLYITDDDFVRSKSGVMNDEGDKIGVSDDKDDSTSIEELSGGIRYQEDWIPYIASEKVLLEIQRDQPKVYAKYAFQNPIIKEKIIKLSTLLDGLQIDALCIDSIAATEQMNPNELLKKDFEKILNSLIEPDQISVLEFFKGKFKVIKQFEKDALRQSYRIKDVGDEVSKKTQKNSRIESKLLFNQKFFKTDEDQKWVIPFQTLLTQTIGNSAYGDLMGIMNAMAGKMDGKTIFMEVKSRAPLLTISRDQWGNISEIELHQENTLNVKVAENPDPIRREAVVIKMACRIALDSAGKINVEYFKRELINSFDPHKRGDKYRKDLEAESTFQLVKALKEGGSHWLERKAEESSLTRDYIDGVLKEISERTGDVD
jgi:hypothetical protein